MKNLLLELRVKNGKLELPVDGWYGSPKIPLVAWLANSNEEVMTKALGDESLFYWVWARRTAHPVPVSNYLHADGSVFVGGPGWLKIRRRVQLMRWWWAFEWQRGHGLWLFHQDSDVARYFNFITLSRYAAERGLRMPTPDLPSCPAFTQLADRRASFSNSAGLLSLDEFAVRTEADLAPAKAANHSFVALVRSLGPSELARHLASEIPAWLDWLSPSNAPHGSRSTGALAAACRACLPSHPDLRLFVEQDEAQKQSMLGFRYTFLWRRSGREQGPELHLTGTRLLPYPVVARFQEWVWAVWRAFHELDAPVPRKYGELTPSTLKCLQELAGPWPLIPDHVAGIRLDERWAASIARSIVGLDGRRDGSTGPIVERLVRTVVQDLLTAMDVQFDKL